MALLEGLIVSDGARIRALDLVLGVRTGAAYTSAVEGGAVTRRRESQPPLVADAVEKVRGIPLERNNRISGGDFLNRTCVFDPHFESILRRGTT